MSFERAKRKLKGHLKKHSVVYSSINRVERMPKHFISFDWSFSSADGIDVEKDFFFEIKFENSDLKYYAVITVLFYYFVIKKRYFKDNGKKIKQTTAIDLSRIIT